MIGVGPEVWDKVGVVGLIVFLAIFHLTAYLREWLVPGRHYRKMLEEKNREIDRLSEANGKSADTIQVQANTINKTDAIGAVTEHLLQSMHELAERRRSQ